MNTEYKFDVIIMGASAGGLHALQELLGELSPSFPVPLVVVQHRSKEQKGLLEEVLQSRCSIKIKQADEKEIIRSGFVYVAPPDYHLLMEGDRSFSLSADEQVRYSRPSIDVFFVSASMVFKKRVAAIILTGANSDGAFGIEEVRRNGGFTIAQDPSEAEYKQMPAAAIKTGKVLRIWKLSEIAGFLKQVQNND